MKHQSVLSKGGLLAVSLILLFALEGFSKSLDIYVSPKGSDSNSGTQSSPIKSLEKAKDLSQSVRSKDPNKSVTIYIEDGVYPLENPIVFIKLIERYECTVVIRESIHEFNSSIS